jgi:hypothetical protein
MNEESRPAKAAPRRNSVDRQVSTHYGRRNREHELDRMVSTATYRRERARIGRGFHFELPPSLREKA